MKKIYLTLFLAAFLIFSNVLAVSSLTNSQKNQVAQSFYNTGATFMRGEEFPVSYTHLQNLSMQIYF